MIPLSVVKHLEAVESTLRVNVRGDEACVEVIAIGVNTKFFVNMTTAVWREFCQRQLAVPPPLPKKGKP